MIGSHQRVAAASILIVSSLSLSACFSLTPVYTEPPSRAVGFEDVKLATVYINAEGDFIEPGTLEPYEGAWVGSGFIVSESGLVVTNNHVVTGADSLEVFLGGDQSNGVSGTVVGASECLDLAIIQLKASTDDNDENTIDNTTYPFLDWYEGEIKPGLDVYSAGYPVGAVEEFTLTRGIVSKDGFAFDTEWASLDEVIEHDARIRGGNSGGPLVDSEGQVVGVNYAGDNTLDYNYAIHRDIVLGAFDQLAAGDEVQSIGVNAEGWGSDDGSIAGVWVASVETDSAAADAGLQAGDIISTLAGVDVGADGTLAAYCQVIEDNAAGTYEVTAYRPSTDEILKGEIHGEPLEVTQSGVYGGTTNNTGFVSIEDDNGIVTVDAPAEWTDVITEPYVDSDGRNWSAIDAAPVLDEYWGTNTAFGMQVSTTDAGSPVEDELARSSIKYEQTCTPLTANEPFDDDLYVGVYSQWTCESTIATVISTIAEDGQNVVVNVQASDDVAGEAILDAVASSFYAVWDD